MRVVIAGGGTGGHLYPGLALAEELGKRNVEVMFVGSMSGPESGIVPQQGYLFEAIKIMGRGRGFSLRNVRALGRLVAATSRCVWIVGRFEPDVVVGTGGYVSLPAVLAAGLHRIPVVVHEQNRVLGLANRIASKLAKAIAVSFPGTEAAFGDRGHVTGNPIRQQIANIDRSGLRLEAIRHFDLDPTRRTILVFGGSQGARNLNEALIQNLPRWVGRSDLQILIVAGPNLLGEVEDSLSGAGIHEAGLLVRAIGYTDRMDLAYSSCDLVVARAGASTIFEVACAGIPAIFVPLAISLDDDQRQNAQAVVDVGGALVVSDSDAQTQLGPVIESMIDDEDRLREMGDSIGQIARPNAAKLLADIVLHFGGGSAGSNSHPIPNADDVGVPSGWNSSHGRVHMIGIGGAGMSALAEFLLRTGIIVSGSDLNLSRTTEQLVGLGAGVISGHSADSIGGADLVIYSAAIGIDNPELVEARRRGIPTMSRAQALARALDGKRVLAFSGTHGKTTSSAMAATILETSGLDPSYLIGGELAGRGSGARLGSSKLVVVEADEAYGSFLHLVPSVAVVLNVDIDHLDYYGNYEAIESAFVEFMSKATEKVLVCADDVNAMRAATWMSDFDTFGISSQARVSAGNIDIRSGGSTFELMIDGESHGVVSLPVPGTHRVQNAIAAAAACLSVGVSPMEVITGLGKFEGVSRRFEARGRFDGVDLYDDYAHLPREIEAMIATARLGDWKRIVAVFQPHLYSRTEAFAREFGEALVAADVIVVTDVYRAREMPIRGVTGKIIVDAACEASPGRRIAYMPTLADAAGFVLREVREGDLVLSLGAGDVTTFPDMVLKQVSLNA